MRPPRRIHLLCLFFATALLWPCLHSGPQSQAVAGDSLPLTLASAEEQGTQSSSSSKTHGPDASEAFGAESSEGGDLSASAINRMEPEEKERLVEQGRLRKINTPFGAVYKPVN
ncbi:MAG: hypothetical protein ACOCVU_00405 [Desulfohalobiaceae bacterium]